MPRQSPATTPAALAALHVLEYGAEGSRESPGRRARSADTLMDKILRRHDIHPGAVAYMRHFWPKEFPPVVGELANAAFFRAIRRAILDLARRRPDAERALPLAHAVASLGPCGAEFDAATGRLRTPDSAKCAAYFRAVASALLAALPNLRDRVVEDLAELPVGREHLLHELGVAVNRLLTASADAPRVDARERQRLLRVAFPGLVEASRAGAYWNWGAVGEVNERRLRARLDALRAHFRRTFPLRASIARRHSQIRREPSRARVVELTRELARREAELEALEARAAK